MRIELMYTAYITLQDFYGAILAVVDYTRGCGGGCERYCCFGRSERAQRWPTCCALDDT